MNSYIKFVLRYRFFVLALLIVITILAGAALSTAKLSGSLADFFLGDSPKFRHYMDRVNQFGSDTLIIIAVEEENLLSKSSIIKLKTVTDSIKSIPQAKSVKSFFGPSGC